MTIQVALTHRTQYRYDRAVALGPHLVRLRPAPHCRTPISAYGLDIAPAKHFINWQQDPFGNFIARVVVPEKAIEFSAAVSLIADMAPINPFDFFVDDGAQDFPFAYDPATAKDLRPFLDAPTRGPLLDRYLSDIDVSPRSTITVISDLNMALSRRIAYRTRMEPGVQSAEETLQIASGSCRDTGWLLVQILRHFGLAARFVSGYLIQLADDARPDKRDSADLHAWAEVYVPGAGWIGLDPTSGLFAGEGHVPLAATPSPLSAAPITGSHEQAQVDFSFAIDVTRIRETPRTSRPYSEAQWQAILATGDRVEERLQAEDVRLTMGGEPTFVAADDPMAPEWTIAAVGPTKQSYADQMVRTLRARFAPGGLLHHGIGKWYPGEQAARWAYGLYWRKDGEPLWQDDALIATASTSPASASSMKTFAAALCRNLGVSADCAIPVYEDPAHTLLMERKLPVGITLDDARLANSTERDRLMQTFERGFGRPAGYVLPLIVTQADRGKRQWISERWTFRRGHLFLLPGDSPLGLRLPLGSLREIDYVDYPHVEPLDPFAPRGSLPAEPLRGETAAGGERAQDAHGHVRTALALEVRNNLLHIFLPPTADAEDYAALVSAIEKTARHLDQPIRLEGYEPPYDPRLAVIKVTPDPGVIEVNVHPAATWRETVAMDETVYGAANSVGLTADKFMPDGRQCGTGGGNHVVLGGITPADSPFLRRPDLLASIIAYWQNHPALSYLFSGLFVGPTSQAPRIDEARHDSLYELEIALQRIPGPDKGVPPWLIDRLLRNLLVDVTGNTHRAEICIDKLYSPTGIMGRLGLVEFRAFEMPPHARMSAAQQLLIRALVAWFWQEPYRRPLVRWGTALHDRFMLPHFLWLDLESIVTNLRSAGVMLEAEWYAPHFEFRCPYVGQITQQGVTLELRHALEPWLVLGEEGESGTSRMVDSSIERLQAKVMGLTGDRYQIACNGYALPLAGTGSTGQAVAGIRFRTFQPTHGFHPTIRPHVPLTFDIYDTWTGRSIGGCRYHATHPAGQASMVRPVNAREAHARRSARFEDIGHASGSTPPKVARVHAEFPLTLDLRRGD